ncbi:hypothetical protein R3P38DRAFT_3244176 [Favolaschia claudopus]|uniref:Uncharacterized protein n=1 Tax=Favolaschia claudopus TaxID=2862362 RepID=A0AAV9Z256_9AGAR
MTSTTAHQVLQGLLAHESLKDNLQFIHVRRFFEITSRVWPEITPAGQARPLILSESIVNFLASMLSLDNEIIQLMWHAFGDLAEQMKDSSETQSTLDDTFRVHAHENEIEPLLPPLSTCLFCETTQPRLMREEYCTNPSTVAGCTEKAQPGFRTCTIESHRKFQLDAEEKNAAMFQLRSRLKNTSISHVPLAGSSDELGPDSSYNTDFELRSTTK